MGWEGGPWGAEAESSPSPPHSRPRPPPGMTTEASSMKPSLSTAPASKEVCKGRQQHEDPSERSGLRSVVTKTKRGARRSSLVDDVDKRTSAHVRCRDAVRTRGLSPLLGLLPVFNPCQEAAGARRMAAQRPSCRPASQTQTGLASMENPPAQPEGKKWSPPKKNQSQPRGPWHPPRPPQLQPARPIGPARSATRRSQPWAEPREWVTASRPRHGSRHLKHAPAKTARDPSPPFFLAFRHLSPLGSCLCHSGPGRPRRLAAVRSARGDAVAFLAGCLVS